MPYNHRRGLLAWIEPVEHLVRCLLVTSAITFLLMTVKGRELLRRTRKMAIPQRSGFGRASLQHAQERIVMPHPGWHTIANAPRPKPAEPAPRQEPAPAMSLDPATWTCPFHVIRWRLPEDDTAAPQLAAPRSAAFNRLLRSIRDPYLPGASCAPSQQGRVPRHSGNPCAVNLARRLEAVGRVLANPQRHILRVARYLARLPKSSAG